MSAWTQERWDHFAKRTHRRGLLQMRPAAIRARAQARRPTQRELKLDKRKSNMEKAHDEWLADNPASYESCLVARQRKAIGKRHQRRRMRRATQQAQRRRARR